MSRSYRKQPVWKDSGPAMKAIVNRRVRRALNRDYNLELGNSLYKRYFFYNYSFIVAKNFEEYYQQEIVRWKNEQVRDWPFRRDEPFPPRREVYKEWLSYRGK